jgi:hypothetical protein
MTPQMVAHKIISQCVAELAKFGVDPTSIRMALALNLVLVARHSHPAGDQGARTDVDAVLASPPRKT